MLHPETCPILVDRLMADFADHLFFKGHHIGDLQKCVAAVKFFHPQLCPGTLVFHFPRAHRALTGWGKTSPGQMRLPIPHVALTAMMGCMFEAGLPFTARAHYFQYDTYLRPGELAGVLVRHLIGPPAHSYASVSQRWGLMLAPREEGGAPTKNGELDESLLPTPRCLRFGGLVRLLSPLLPSHLPVWPLLTTCGSAFNSGHQICQTNKSCINIITYGAKLLSF